MIISILHPLVLTIQVVDDEFDSHGGDEAAPRDGGTGGRPGRGHLVAAVGLRAENVSFQRHIYQARHVKRHWNWPHA